MSSRPAPEHPGLLLQAAILVPLLVPSVLVQLAIPSSASNFAATEPGVADLVVPYSAAAILFIACGQVALLAAWRLLWLPGDGHRPARRRWASVIVACAAIATALTVVVLVHLFRFAPGGGGPSVYPIAVTAIAGAVTTVLLVRWSRRLGSAITRPETGDPGG